MQKKIPLNVKLGYNLLSESMCKPAGMTRKTSVPTKTNQSPWWAPPKPQIYIFGLTWSLFCVRVLKIFVYSGFTLDLPFENLLLLGVHSGFAFWKFVSTWSLLWVCVLNICMYSGSILGLFGVCFWGVL